MANTDVIIGTTELSNAANKINILHGEIESLFRLSIEKAMEIGAILTEIKPMTGHGNFKNWIADNCKFSYRAAANYMKIYTYRNEIAQNGILSLEAAKTFLRNINKENSPENALLEDKSARRALLNEEISAETTAIDVDDHEERPFSSAEKREIELLLESGANREIAEAFIFRKRADRKEKAKTKSKPQFRHFKTKKEVYKKLSDNAKRQNLDIAEYLELLG